MVIRGRRSYEQQKLEAQRALHYELAGLISFAVHSPKKMPKFKTMDEAKQRVPDREPTEADHDMIRAHLMKFVRAGNG